MADSGEDRQPPATVIIVPQREVTIRRFHGDGHADEVERFIRDVSRAWKVRKDLSDEERRDFLWSHLGESVLAELKCHPKVVRDNPEETFKVLRAIYGEQRSVSQLTGAFQQIHQHRAESVRAYSHRLHEAFESLTARQEALKVSLTDEQILRDHFVENLQDPILRRYLGEELYKSPGTTFLELRNAAIRWCGDEQPTTFEARSSAVTSSQATTELEGLVLTLTKQVSDLATQLQEMQRAQAKLSTQPREPPRAPAKRFRNFRRSLNCYICNSPAHITRDCPKNGLPQ
ncbi:uncharacterized protein LOC131942651 [Physella acuta]|uniref:uncharacterized protein LOC131942651 n=1 Tax=Physella acuta TaxID=109671 RepID=UPI0027DACD41|nr:uncharacterized protein LOC131942651 [Physella acuta]